jgi:pyruvate dehydrogenase E2 component (dihydrolipoamide acetyltransferase)
MATTVIMPRQGQSVESCIIVEWKVAVGATVAEGDVLCDVETDKATLEVPAPVAGVLLEQLYPAGAEVPVLAPIATVGEPGEVAPAQDAAPAGAPAAAEPAAAQPAAVEPVAPAPSASTVAETAPAAASGRGAPASPRARGLAERKGVDVAALTGSGPGGRIIERDVAAVATEQPRLTPVARAMVAEGGYTVPGQGSGPGGRVMSRDLRHAEEVAAQTTAAPAAAPAMQPATQSAPTAAAAVSGGDGVTRTAVKGVRKVIAERMLASLQTTAQLTMNASADARALQALRKRLKESPEAMGLRGVTINDLVLFAVARTLTQHADINAHFVTESGEGAILQWAAVHLAFAVDTPRGLLVPVIRNAEQLTLRALAAEGKRLAVAAQAGKSAPDDLQGGTFTVTNLGGFGIESFTPVLNPPQVAILGVGNIQLKPVQGQDAVEFVPHIGLSLTINHQVVDGAPGARFLQTLAANIAAIDLLPLG